MVLHIGAGGARIGEAGIARSGGGAGIANLFGEGFGGFQPRRCRRGAKGQQARRTGRIGNARGQGGFWPDDHEIHGVQGAEIHHRRRVQNVDDEDALAVIRQREMGFVFQSFHLLPTLTVAENIAFPLDIARRPNKARVNELIEAVDLDHRRNSLPNQLSGGEQQRTAVARALVSQPKIVFADEPTGNLDEQNANQVMQLLLDLRQQVGSALVVVTHDAALAELADRVITMHDGRIVS